MTPFSSFKPTSTPTTIATNGTLTTNNLKTNEIIDLTSNKKDESALTIQKTTTISTNKNINESELVFINELNDLYEKCYGTGNRTFKIPNEDAITSKLDSNEPETKYAYLLAELNKHVSKWISKHVEENPLVILTPVFVDYFNYLLLLEKEFFPSSFKEYGINKTKKINKLEENNENKEPQSNKLINGTSVASNGKEDVKESDSNPSQLKHVNGINEPEKNLVDSSKTFANLMKSNSTQPFSQINLFNTNTSSSSTAQTNATNATSNLFAFKPLEANKDKNDLTSSLSTNSNLFKFGSNNSISSAASSMTSSNSVNSITSSLSSGQSATSSSESPAMSSSSEQPKPSLFSKSPSLTSPVSSQSSSSASTNLASVAPSFKFGSSTTTTSTSPPKTESSSSKSEDATKKSDETTPATSGFFSFINKPTVTSSTETIKSSTESTPSIFKSFSSFQSGSTTTASSSLFSTTTPATTNLTTPSSTPFFSFQASSKSSIFGSAAFGSSVDSTSNSSSLFGSATAAPFGVAQSGENEADDGNIYS